MSKRTAKKKASGIHIREVEKKLFSYLFINKVATSKQIARDLYNQISHQALYKRLNQLIKLKLIEATYHKELCGSLVYNLTPLAASKYLGLSKTKGMRMQLKSQAILHDLDLLDLRCRLKQLSIVEKVYSENLLLSHFELQDEEVLTSFRDFHFDGVLKILSQNQSYFLPLEYERSVKFASRYESYFKRIYANNAIQGLLFICKDENILKLLRSKEEQFAKEILRKVFYANLSDVLNSQNSVSFENLNREKIILS